MSKMNRFTNEYDDSSDVEDQGACVCDAPECVCSQVEKEIKEIEQMLEEECEYESRKELEHRELMEKVAQETVEENKLAEMDQWWEENGERVYALEEKERQTRASEKEMAEEYEKFMVVCRAEDEVKAEEERKMWKARELEVCQWYEEHYGNTKITHEMNLEEKYNTMIEELKEEREERRKRQAAEAAKKFEERARRMREVQSKEARARARAKAARPNAKGRQQGKKRKAEIKRKAMEEMKKQKQLKAEGKESTYKGARVQRREKQAKAAAQVVIVPKDNTVQQPKIEDGSDEESEDEFYNMPIRATPQIVLNQTSPRTRAPVEVEPELSEPEQTNEEFAQVWTTVTGKSRSKGEAEGKKARRNTPLNIQVGRSLISQCREERATRDPKYKARMGGFNTLGDKKALDKKLTRTKMCRSVAQKRRCPHGKNCRFAHSIEELARKECAFGQGCRMIRHLGNGVYEDKPSQRSGKTCSCWHPNETEASFAKRMGLPTPKPTKTPTPKAPHTQYRAPTAPWAKSRSSAGKSRSSAGKSSPDPRPKTRRSRWGPKPPSAQEKANAIAAKLTQRLATPTEETVIRVPRCMAAQAMQMAMTQGLRNFRIEIC